MAEGSKTQKAITRALRIEVNPSYSSLFLLAITRLMSSTGLEPQEMIVRAMRIWDREVWIERMLKTVRMKSIKAKNIKTMARNASSGNRFIGRIRCKIVITGQHMKLKNLSNLLSSQSPLFSLICY